MMAKISVKGKDMHPPKTKPLSEEIVAWIEGK